MIICTYLELEIGELIVNGVVTDANVKDATVSFVVIKKVSKEEYIKQCEEYKCDISGLDLTLPNYYEVRMD